MRSAKSSTADLTGQLSNPSLPSAKVSGDLEKPSYSNRRPPPYHGGFELRLCGTGRALTSALSLQFGWFFFAAHRSSNSPEPP